MLLGSMKRTSIWSLKKERWFQGPKLLENYAKAGTFHIAAINRTAVLFSALKYANGLITEVLDNNQAYAWAIYDFKSNQWKELFLKHFEYYSLKETSSFILIDKLGKM